jgi:3-hydroxyisobutyrate dehydrogenase-like beta-hydroxyacid dehydrogenase
MGSRMAASLARAGHAIAVWNRDPAKAEPLGHAGATLAGNPRAAASGADFVFSMVTDDAAARDVWLDPETGALTGMKAGTVAIECSTVTPAWIEELGAAAARKGVSLLDAPVAGSRPQAEAGQLVFMVGGDASAFARVEPLLAPLAAKAIHVGGPGQGAVLKLAVNALFAAQLASVAELLGFLSRNGFEAGRAAELLGAFPIVAPPIAGAAKMMATKNTTPLFTIDLIEKDLGYIIDTARASGADLPGASSARASFQRARELGLGRSNVSGLAAVFA